MQPVKVENEKLTISEQSRNRERDSGYMGKEESMGDQT